MSVGRSVAQNGTQSVSLSRVMRGDLCSGCGACAGLFAGRIAMADAGTGWPRPVQTHPLTPAEDAALAAICPGLGQRAEPVEMGTDDALWGRVGGMRLAWSTNDALRHRAASGGGLSAVLAHLLDSGRVDAVIQTAAAIPPDAAYANRTVLVDDLLGVMDAAGSRYAASSPLAGLADWVADGRRFAFVGKPCDAAALRALVHRDARVAAVFPVILSFFCAGVPSRAGGQALVAAMGADAAQLTTFRYRGNGWPGAAVATMADGSTRQMSYHDSWGGVLSKHLQHRCKVCADGTGTAADLSFGDPWQTDAQGYPVFADAPGQSLAVIRTLLGADILRGAEASGHLVTADFDSRTLAAIQPGQRKRRRELLARLFALRLAGRPVPAYRGMRLWAAAAQERPLAHLRAFGGMLRRSLRRRVGNP